MLKKYKTFSLFLLNSIVPLLLEGTPPDFIVGEHVRSVFDENEKELKGFKDPAEEINPKYLKIIIDIATRELEQTDVESIKNTKNKFDKASRAIRLLECFYNNQIAKGKKEFELKKTNLLIVKSKHVLMTLREKRHEITQQDFKDIMGQIQRRLKNREIRDYHQSRFTQLHALLSLESVTLGFKHSKEYVEDSYNYFLETGLNDCKREPHIGKVRYLLAAKILAGAYKNNITFRTLSIEGMVYAANTFLNFAKEIDNQTKLHTKEDTKQEDILEQAGSLPTIIRIRSKDSSVLTSTKRDTVSSKVESDADGQSSPDTDEEELVEEETALMHRQEETPKNSQEAAHGNSQEIDYSQVAIEEWNEEVAKSLRSHFSPINTIGALLDSDPYFCNEGQRRDFNMQNVSGDRLRCFFYSIGLEPEVQKRLLLENKNNPEIRLMIANEIKSMMGIGIDVMPQNLLGVYEQKFKTQQDHINKIREQGENRLADLLQEASWKEIEQYSRTVEAYELYCEIIGQFWMHVERNRNEATKNYLSAIDAISKLNKIGIIVYQDKANGGRHELTIYHKFIPNNANCIVHLYHSERGQHFQSLKVIEEQSHSLSIPGTSNEGDPSIMQSSPANDSLRSDKKRPMPDSEVKECDEINPPERKIPCNSSGEIEAVGLPIVASMGKTEIEELEKAANQGNREAQYSLALILRREGKRDQAITWFEKAANGGVAMAQYNLGIILRQEGKEDEAITWFEKAANQGTPMAQCTLGCILRKEGKLHQARIWLTRAAKQGNGQAQCEARKMGWHWR